LGVHVLKTAEFDFFVRQLRSCYKVTQVSARQGKNQQDKIAGSDFEQQSLATLARMGVGQDARNKAQFTRE
jgi:hypothetical protein